MLGCDSWIAAAGSAALHLSSCGGLNICRRMSPLPATTPCLCPSCLQPRLVVAGPHLQARAAAPAIIFIVEIDSVGRIRCVVSICAGLSEA